MAVIAMASDFDNTLYFDRELPQIRAADRAAVEKFRQAGGLFGLCTGRSLQGILGAVNPPIDYDFYILASGALILDENRQVLRRRTIPRALMNELFARFSSRLAMVVQANDTVYSMLKDFPLQTYVNSLDEIPGDCIYGVSFALESGEAAGEMADYLNRTYAGQVAAYRNVKFVDMVPYGCGKGTAALEVKNLLGIDRLAGIGDSYNDLPLLEAADVSFTFRASDAPVRAKADYTVDSVAEALDLLKK